MSEVYERSPMSESTRLSQSPYWRGVLFSCKTGSSKDLRVSPAFSPMTCREFPLPSIDCGKGGMNCPRLVPPKHNKLVDCWVRGGDFGGGPGGGGGTKASSSPALTKDPTEPWDQLSPAICAKPFLNFLPHPSNTVIGIVQSGRFPHDLFGEYFVGIPHISTSHPGGFNLGFTTPEGVHPIPASKALLIPAKIRSAIRRDTSRGTMKPRINRSRRTQLRSACLSSTFLSSCRFAYVVAFNSPTTWTSQNWFAARRRDDFHSTSSHTIRGIPRIPYWWILLTSSYTFAISTRFRSFTPWRFISKTGSGFSWLWPRWLLPGFTALRLTNNNLSDFRVLTPCGPILKVNIT